MIPIRNAQLKKGLEDMCQYLRFHGVNSIIEVGCWAGVGSGIFANYFDIVYCIDPWEPTKDTISAKYSMKDVEKEFDNRIKLYNNIRKIKSRIENFDLFPVDCIYIDADHHYKFVRENIEQCLPFCKIISGHDYWAKKFPGVVRAVNEVLGAPDKLFCDTSWVKKIR